LYKSAHTFLTFRKQKQKRNSKKEETICVTISGTKIRKIKLSSKRDKNATSPAETAYYGLSNK